MENKNYKIIIGANLTQAPSGYHCFQIGCGIAEYDLFNPNSFFYQFLETGTSDRTRKGFDQLLGFSLYPLSYFLYSSFKVTGVTLGLCKHFLELMKSFKVKKAACSALNSEFSHAKVFYGEIYMVGLFKNRISEVYYTISRIKSFLVKPVLLHINNIK